MLQYRIHRRISDAIGFYPEHTCRFDLCFLSCSKPKSQVAFILIWAGGFPKVIKYSNRCPPEESGGAKGFLNKLEIMEDWTHPDYEYVVDWFNEDYEWYYVDDVNERLRNLERIEPGNTLGAEDIEEIMTAFINDTSADYYFDVVEKKVFRDHKGVVEDEPDRYLMVRTAKADVLDRIMREFALTRNTVKDARPLGNAMASRTKRLAKFVRRSEGSDTRGNGDTSSGPPATPWPRIGPTRTDSSQRKIRPSSSLPNG